MQALVVYESLFGNTEQIAQAIRGALAEHGTTRLMTVDQVGETDLVAVDLLVLGCPTQHHEATPDTLALLDRLPHGALEQLPVAVFDTRYHMSRLLSGSAAHVIGKEIGQRGGRLVAPAESFFVTDREGPLEAGEVERAAAWAASLQARLRPAARART